MRRLTKSDVALAENLGRQARSMPRPGPLILARPFYEALKAAGGDMRDLATTRPIPTKATL